MKKTLYLLFMVLSCQVMAQDYYHGIGIGINYGVFISDYQTPFSSISSFELPATGIIYYKASLALTDPEPVAFMVSAYPGLGGFISSNYGAALGLQLPISAEVSFGDLEGKNFNLGAGFAVNAVITSSSGGGLVVGPHASMGYQFGKGSRVWGIRGTFTYGLNRNNSIPVDATVTTDTKFMIGLGAHMMFGLRN